MTKRRRKNILLVTFDQWRADCLSAVGHPCLETPNLDALAADGMLFRRHYTQASPCGPARASLLTGLYAHNHRSVRNG
ncbi:MAG TPA: sulfatase-like hydrolase/transferase, partial [Stellaceae bacterium]|nr:sulfatase-like hydrolase/transferase [Stellaceae bacterium]